MHSSFKDKHSFNRRHTLNPYSRNLSFGSATSQQSVRDQEFETHRQNRQELRFPLPSSNSSSDTLPLRLVFSRTVDMTSKQTYYKVDPNMYFRRKSNETAEHRLQFPSGRPIENPKSRLPLIDLKQENNTEFLFRSDSFQTFRSVAGPHANKENCAQHLEGAEGFNFRPTRKQISNTDQHQQKTKHMFDFGTEPRRGVNLDQRQQNMSNKLMSTTDFLVTPNSYRCSSPAKSGVSSPHLSIPSSDEDNIFLESLRPNLSPNLNDTSAINFDSVVEGMEQLTCNESISGNISSAFPSSRTCDSLDHLLDFTLSSSSEENSSCCSSAIRKYIGCVSDNRQQMFHSSYQEGSGCCFGASGQDNKKRDQRGCGQNSYRNCEVTRHNNLFNQDETNRNSITNPRNDYYNRRQHNVDKILYQRKSDAVFVDSSRSDRIQEKSFDRIFSQGGRGQAISVDRRNRHDSYYNQAGIGGNFQNGRQNYGIGQQNICRSYTREGSEISTQNHDGISSKGRCNQEGGEQNFFNNNQRVDNIEMNPIYWRQNQEGGVQISVNITQNNNEAGMSSITGICNEGSSSQNSVSIRRNNTLQHINSERRCNDQEVVDFEELASLLSDNFYIGSDSDHDCRSVSSEAIIPRHLLNHWRLPSNTENMNCRQNDQINSEIILDCQQNNHMKSESILDRQQNNHMNSEIILDCRQNNRMNSENILDCQQNNHMNSENILDRRQNDTRNSEIIISDDDDDDNFAEDDVDIRDGFPVDVDTARGQHGGNQVAVSVNHQQRSSKKGFGRFPLLSDPDEE